MTKRQYHMHPQICKQFQLLPVHYVCVSHTISITCSDFIVEFKYFTSFWYNYDDDAEHTRVVKASLIVFIFVKTILKKSKILSCGIESIHSPLNWQECKEFTKELITAYFRFPSGRLWNLLFFQSLLEFANTFTFSKYFPQINRLFTLTTAKILFRSIMNKKTNIL